MLFNHIISALSFIHCRQLRNAFPLIGKISTFWSICKALKVKICIDLASFIFADLKPCSLVIPLFLFVQMVCSITLSSPYIFRQDFCKLDSIGNPKCVFYQVNNENSSLFRNLSLISTLISLFQDVSLNNRWCMLGVRIS